jgi:hypothetical protein
LVKVGRRLGGGTGCRLSAGVLMCRLQNPTRGKE